jgi:hypothetical protein
MRSPLRSPRGSMASRDRNGPTVAWRFAAKWQTARVVAVPPARRRPAPSHPDADLLCPQTWNVPISDAFRRFQRSRRGYEEGLRVSAACQRMSEPCEDGEILSASGDASQHGCCLGLARHPGRAQPLQERRIELVESGIARAVFVVAGTAIEQDRVAVGADQPGLR